MLRWVLPYQNQLFQPFDACCIPRLWNGYMMYTERMIKPNRPDKQLAVYSLQAFGSHNECASSSSLPKSQLKANLTITWQDTCKWRNACCCSAVNVNLRLRISRDGYHDTRSSHASNLLMTPDQKWNVLYTYIICTLIYCTAFIWVHLIRLGLCGHERKPKETTNLTMPGICMSPISIRSIGAPNRVPTRIAAKVTANQLQLRLSSTAT